MRSARRHRTGFTVFCCAATVADPLSSLPTLTAPGCRRSGRAPDRDHLRRPESGPADRVHPPRNAITSGERRLGSGGAAPLDATTRALAITGATL